MEKTVNVGGQAVRMRATALIPRLYRFTVGRDMIADMRTLQKSYQKILELPENASVEERADAQFSVLDLTIFENVAWCMAKQADDTIPDTPDAWLDSIEGIFSIYEVLPEILNLWQDSIQTTSTERKK